ncbi:hypothetical protein ACF06W_11835 [Streptomyces albus]|uniref:hypothetical protein n=1 Tax=Streptomyces albus TaxID=1888 RepID=UPI0037001FCB
MAEENNPVRQALAKVLRDGEVEAVIMHRKTRVPEEVVEAAVEGLPVHLVGDEREANLAEQKPDFEIRTADDVTDEVLEIVKGIVEGWYDEGPIDWENVWDRVEKARLDDGRGIDMGEDLDSPAIRKIKKEVRAWRRLG